MIHNALVNTQCGYWIICLLALAASQLWNRQVEGLKMPCGKSELLNVMTKERV